MKTNNMIYWVSTSLVALMMAFSAIMYFSNPQMAEGFHHLGFPDYFRKELGIGKLIGALLLLLPMIPGRVKEWVYAAFGIVFISAIIAHATVDGASGAVAPVIPFVLLLVSYFYYSKINERKTAIA